jgi:hypothetical protein
MKRVAIFALLPLAALALVAAMIATALIVRESGDSEKPADAGASSAEEPEPSSSPRLAPESSVCQGILHVPESGAPQSFSPEYTQFRKASGFTIVANADVDEKALDEAVETVERVFRNNDLEDPLIAEGAYVIVADGEQGVLELPEFRCMDTAENQDFYSHVCGVADRADYPVVTVNERDLVGNRRGPCGGLNILYHELGHMVQGWALPPADYFDIRQFFQDAMSSGKYKNEYASRNANEYFAEAVQAYFLTQDGESRDRDWLERYDPQIYELLSRTFGE